MSVFLIINTIFGLIFFILYAYQGYYIFAVLKRPPRIFPEADPRRYAVLICARDEEHVIGHLIGSIKEQEYPSDFIDIFVLADNCTDNTAKVAEEKGAVVFQRENKKMIGKGYALEFLIDHITEGGTKWDYEGYVIVDADNLLDKHFISEMNKAIAAGNKIVTGYRNSKNFGDNWLSSGYALWFLRESKYLNNAREILGLSSQVNGTGFVVHRDILKKYGGWKFHTLTEDVEFSFAMAANGERIACNKAAVIFDEQPDEFINSWKQRTRWVKGYFQAYSKFGAKLVEGFFKRRDFSCYDMLMSTFAGTVLSVLLVVLYIILTSIFLIIGHPLEHAFIWLGVYFAGVYFGLVALGVFTTKSEWNMIQCSSKKKKLYCLTFPLFLLVFLLVALFAPFSRERWSHVDHVRELDIEDIEDIEADV
jgi:cellulose synthase/poly-beta-1,6-N-acetylglucosamine synthase-like glycosyltransferase